MTDSSDAVRVHDRLPFVSLVLLGAAAGVLSGLFGIGGGTILVPGFALWLGMNQKLAAGTSAAAILPAAVVGAITYGLQGNVDWLAGLFLAIGIVAGAQVGTLLLARLDVTAVKWVFIVFLLVVVVSLWIVVPQRDAVITIDFFAAAMLVVTGILTGIVAGLVGVGGGIIVVPVLMFFFGSSDLTAKGTSLLMMIPGSLSGTVSNYRRRNVDMRSAAVAGITACFFAPLGALLAGLLDPFVGNVLFSLYLGFVMIQMLLRLIRQSR